MDSLHTNFTITVPSVHVSPTPTAHPVLPCTQTSPNTSQQTDTRRLTESHVPTTVYHHSWWCPRPPGISVPTLKLHLTLKSCPCRIHIDSDHIPIQRFLYWMFHTHILETLDHNIIYIHTHLTLYIWLSFILVHHLTNISAHLHVCTHPVRMSQHT